MKILKRDGRIESYDEIRVWKAVAKALESVGVDGLTLVTQADLVCTRVEEEITPMDKYAISVEEIHDIVQKELKNINYEAGLSYQKYREQRNIARESQRLTNLDENVLNKHSDRASNGNVDENSFGGKEGLILEGEMEAIALNKMNILFSTKHRDREIYIHDLNKYAFGMHNCLVLDAESLLNEGANVGQGDLRPTKRFSTAMQLIPVYIQIQSMSMFGGCATGHLDFIMQPYIERLIADKYVEVVEVTSGERLNIEKMTIHDLFDSYDDQEGSFLCNLIMKRVEEQIHQSCQALITNLVTLQTRGTQTPFSSINFGGNVSKEGQMFNRILLEEMDRGIGRKNKTAIFPILCYYTRSDLNLYEGTPGYDLTIKAIEVQGRRHFPTFVNGDWTLIPPSDDYRNWHCRMG